MMMGLRVLLALVGLFFIGLGGTFLFDPVTQGGDFGVDPRGAQGLSTIRADFSSYFWVSGGALVLGAWKQNGTVLLVAAALLGITFCARALSLVLDGTYEGWMAPMMVEAFVVVIALFGYRAMAGSAAPDA